MEINFKTSGTNFKREADNVNYGEFSKFQKSGIYSITNNINGLVYIGASLEINRRVMKHFSELRFNRHRTKKLQLDYNQYGYDNFTIAIVEEASDNLLELEVKYQLLIGIERLYNEKITGHYITEEYRNILKNTSKETHKTKNYREKMSELKTKYRVAKFDKLGNLIETFDSIEFIIITNPTYKVNVIRGVCNGSKSSYDGFLWRYIDKDNNLLKNNRDI